MPNNVGYFAIECDDVERAKRFYEAVMGWRIEPWGPPGYYHIYTGTKDKPGILGALQGRRGPKGPGNHGFECTVNVEDLDAVIAAVEAGGGRIDMPRYRIEGVGVLIYFEDTEGNRVGAMQYDGPQVWPEGVLGTS